MQLEIGDFAGVAGVLIAIVGPAVAFINMRINSLSASMAKHEERIEKLERNKVDKYAWAKEEVTTRGKVDRLNEQMAGLIARFETSWGVGAAVNRLADVIEKKREADGA